MLVSRIYICLTLLADFEFLIGKDFFRGIPALLLVIVLFLDSPFFVKLVKCRQLAIPKVLSVFKG